MTVINTNVKALFTQAALKVAGRDGQIAMEQLSTGKRINNSKDDAAGLAIAARMTQNIQGLNQSIRNAGDAISMIQTAEGATQEITVMLQRMSELAVQAANSTYSADQRSYLDQEFQQLKQEIIRVSEMHEWNGFPILNGKAGTPVGNPTTTSIVRAGVEATATGKQLMDGDLEIKTDKGSFAIPASVAAADSKSNTIAAGSNNAGSAIAIAAAINSQVGNTGVSAVAGAASISATKTTVGSTSAQTDLYVNGEKVSLSLAASHTLSQRRQYVMESINAGTAVHGVVAGDSGTGGLTLTTPDGRNLSVWYDSTSVQGSDFGLGLDTTPPSSPLGVTGVSAAAASAFGANETTAITFPALTRGESFTLNGMTFTSTATTTANELAAAFSNLKSGMTALAAAAANPAAVTKGSFSGTFAEGFTTGTSNGVNVVTATATSKGNVGDIVTSPILTFTTTQGAAAATVAATTAGVGSNQQQESIATFGDLSKGQSVSFAGLTFTAAADGITAAQVASAFKSVGTTTTTVAYNTAASGAQAKWVAANASGHAAIGSFTSGTSLVGTYSASVVATGSADAMVTFKAATPSNTQIDMAPSAAATTAAPVITITPAAGSVPESAIATFVDLKRGQSVSFAGLTFTAAADITADKVATAFKSVGTTAAIDQAAAQTLYSGVSGHAAIGSFTSGTSLAGTFDGASIGTSQVRFTVTATGTASTITSAGVTGANAPNVATTPGKAVQAQVSTATFTDLDAGASVTFAGLTFTSGTAGTKAAELQAAFASIVGTSATTAQTFTQVNATAGALVSDAIGRFTSGTAVTGGTFAAGGSTGQVTWTAIAPTSTFVVGAAIPTAPTLGTFNAGTSPNKSTVSVTFQSLTAGQSATVKGLTFTAKAAMNAADVAKAFSGLLLGETAAQVTTRNAATSSLLGTYTGTNEGGANGYTSGAATAATVLYSGAPALASTTFDSSKTAGTKSTETVVFRELSAGQSVTVNGLTFTAKAAMNAVDVGKAFSGVLTGETAAQVTTRNASTSSLLGTYTGTNTAGYASAATTSATAVYTSVSDAAVSFGTPITGSDTQTVVASTGSVESSVFTFSALKTGQSFTLNGLEFKAKKDLTSAEVASAFGSLTSGTSSTPANTANGDYTGSWKAGYSTAAASGATVTATATVAGSADIEFKSSKSVTAQGFTVPASTVYGTVTLKSQNTFIIKPGANANATATASATDPTFANFSALGFEAKTINAKSIGRLNFQVGPAANQLISIDLADFGKNGDITGLITSDRAPTNLLTVNSANDVIMNVNISLDRIASTRANMGAVMNRLEHVIDNLTNVVMNSEASRSQIEDADYAKASTELARTQIMQQAATAVLAQANTSQQGVLKLLQG